MVAISPDDETEFPYTLWLMSILWRGRSHIVFFLLIPTCQSSNLVSIELTQRFISPDTIDHYDKRTKDLKSEEHDYIQSRPTPLSSITCSWRKEL